MKAWLYASLGGAVLKTLAATWRFRTLHEEIFLAHHAQGGVILPFWHNRIIGACATPFFRPYDTTVVVSQHTDGEIIARIQWKFGHRAVRGSSKRGGAEALREMEMEVKAGSVVGITPDGPRGPKYVVKPGAAVLAVRTGRPVIPFLTFYRSRWKFNSWDGFELPKPFTEMTLIFGGPILSDGDIESTRKRIEEEMKRMVIEGEAIYGRKPDF
jgi:lysophospholipid acyltransferase (LPLAT)-like uncharacterized protein